MDLLRVSTAGSVDDGKSTLIGRMLYDSKGLFDDQLEAARRATRNDTAGEVDLSLLTDGLRAEREQGITIDVAYRYFATPRRKFILADTPGHEQYTRNMATGASTADLAVVLIDARKGVLEQSRRHTAIAALLRIPHLVVAVNKMDLVGFDQAVFDAIRADFHAVAARLGAPEPVFIPVSALRGDNVVDRSAAMPWHDGPTLLHHLETVEVDDTAQAQPFRFPVQLVLRPDHEFRGFAGRISSGEVAVGDEVLVLASGKRARVRRIHTLDGDLERAAAPRSVSLLLDAEIDISRGDLLVHAGQAPRQARSFEAQVVWMDEVPLVPGRPWFLRQGTRWVRASVAEILHRRDLVTLEESPAASLELNDLALVRIETAQPIFLDSYARFRETGSFLLVDPESNRTSGAGMLAAEQPGLARGALHQPTRIERAARIARSGHPGAVVWLTGLCGSGMSTVAYATEARIFLHGSQVLVLDAADLREGLCSDLGGELRSELGHELGSGTLSGGSQARTEKIRRTAEVARLCAQNGQVVLVALPLPLAAHRALARRIIGDTGFLEVHTSAPLQVCRARDPRGLYARAARGELSEILGLDAPYEPPTEADLELPTATETVERCVEALVEELLRRGLLRVAADFTMSGDGI